MDGIGLFAFESFKKIVLANPNTEFLFIFDREPHKDFLYAKNITPIVVGPKARHPLLYIVWYQFSLKRVLKKYKPDVFVGTDGMIPLLTDVKTLAVIHDLNFEHHPEYLPKIIKNYYCNYFPKFSRKSTRIATVSEYSKQDIIDVYEINTEKIDVVYNGPNENFVPVSENEKLNVKAQYTGGQDFFLFIGTLHPRKNLVNLFKAFNQFKIETNSSVKLLIVGRKMWWTGEIEDAYNSLEHKNDIVFGGRINEKELYKITASAFALTYVPFFEGFGIPLVEAMNCGVPVITSNITSMPEVVEDAGVLVDPFSVKEIANAMINLHDNENLRKSLSEKSLFQAKKFSWDKTANLLWQSILKTIETE